MSTKNKISCYKFIFNQSINCQMFQKNFLLLLLFSRKPFFIKKKIAQFAINTVYTLPRTYNITSSTTLVTFIFLYKHAYNTETTTALLAIHC